jgi:putative hydrolase of the HAD superfamily
MYGVIIKESKGNFIPYTYEHFPNTDRSKFPLFTAAQLGEINSREFLTALGFTDPDASMRDYIENYLTLDEGFIPFAERFGGEYRFALLSNDVLAWSDYIREYYGVGRYFADVILSADTGLRKPDRRIFETALARLGVSADECVFIDNSVKNLLSARELGMDTILFNRDGEEYDGKVVNDFTELAGMLSESEVAK